MSTLLPTNRNQFNFSLKSQSQTETLLERCSGMEELKKIHAHMFKTGLIYDTNLTSKLLTFSAMSDYGDLGYARRVFGRIHLPNTFVWNIMIRGYSRIRDIEETLFMYEQMLHTSVQHNSYTFPFLLKAFQDPSALPVILQIHAHIVKTGFSSDVYSVNSLLHVYAKLGNLVSAHQVFEKIQEPDIVSWNTMIDGCVKSGEIRTACELFDKMPEKNIVSWTSMIAGWIANGKFLEALKLFHEMQISGIKPDNLALTSALSACAYLGALKQGRWVHTYIDKNQIQIDSALECSLVDMYAKCGDLEGALRVFRSPGKKSVSVWTAMITGLAIHGRGREAIDIFTKMQNSGIKPNSVTFTGVLTACSYAGLVEKGTLIFQSMETTYHINQSIEHYGCMVDLLGRAGRLKEAEELIEKMPMNPNAAIWGALLSACCTHGDHELGKRVGKTLIEMDSDHGGRYVHLARIFTAMGQLDQALKMRKLMKDKGVSKLPGCSLIELNGIVHEFFAGDQLHPGHKELTSV
ncbi:pentatricopeptide repeat-containing protein At5g66520-like [Papaver somniferum]|uniref:pentatricopeptide repeat-containing protein At5g66520-like n=1 Tax=Papaver somniferum TaxID=3469 RepID=UPI000E6FCEC6|nr:pentatricopeptide repeat-containing protein At5g66520-like [Papaver somniferum]